jgi:hypothetical protein
MYEQEQLFYKWINSVLLDVCHFIPTSTRIPIKIPIVTFEMALTKKKFQEIHFFFTKIHHLWSIHYKKQKKNTKNIEQMEKNAQQITKEMPFCVFSLFLEKSKKKNKQNTHKKEQKNNFLQLFKFKQQESIDFEQEFTKILEQITMFYQVNII